VRVMYVEDCPSCGCAMVRENSAAAPPALLRAATCANVECDCHALLPQGLATAG
jgi:hypothetical protein